MTFVKYKVGDIVRMKKKHPCGADTMEGEDDGKVNRLCD